MKLTEAPYRIHFVFLQANHSAITTQLIYLYSFFFYFQKLSGKSISNFLEYVKELQNHFSKVQGPLASTSPNAETVR